MRSAKASYNSGVGRVELRVVFWNRYSNECSFGPVLALQLQDKLQAAMAQPFARLHTRKPSLISSRRATDQLPELRLDVYIKA